MGDRRKTTMERIGLMRGAGFRVFNRILACVVFCLIVNLPIGVSDDDNNGAKAKGPKVISEAMVPLPPHLFEHGELLAPDREGTEEEQDTVQPIATECKQYDDSICTKCNPPVQDVGERCAQYEVRPDGVCLCKVCETIECK